MSYSLLYYPNEILRTPCEDVTEEDFQSEEFLKFLTKMVDQLAAHKAVGIAAPQLGLNKRVFLNNVDDRPQFFINPKIVHSEGIIRMKEGCLSFPGIFLYTDRAAEVTVDAVDADGREFRAQLDGLDAVAAQHELDHLNGVLFIDHVSRLERKMLLKKFAKNKKKFVFR